MATIDDTSLERITAALADVQAERRKQLEKWGDQSHHPEGTWMRILTEEVGEVAKASLHDEFGGDESGGLRDELVQTAAVAVAWIEAIDSNDAS